MFMTSGRFIFIAIIFMLPAFNNISAQTNSNYIRIAKLTIDSANLTEYRAALKEHAEAAVRLEPGVFMLYAVYDKEHPANVTVFEIYKDEAAYQAHIKTTHFLKYKATVQDMVKSLELVDVIPIVLEAKKEVSR